MGVGRWGHRNGAGQCHGPGAACLEGESRKRLAYLELIAAYLGWDDSQKGKQEFPDAELLSFMGGYRNKGAPEGPPDTAHYHLGLIQTIFLMP